MPTLQINVESFLQAYEKTGIKPTRGSWLYKQGGRNCACGLTALYVSTGADCNELFDELYKDDEDIEETISEKLGLNSDFINGYINGFDSVKFRDEWTQEKKYAYELGKTTWEAVKHLDISDGEE